MIEWFKLFDINYLPWITKPVIRFYAMEAVRLRLTHKNQIRYMLR